MAPHTVGGPFCPRVVFCVVQSSADLYAGLFHSGGSFHIRGYEPILSLLLFVSALALHSRQLDLKLRLDFLWAVQVRKCVCFYVSVPNIKIFCQSLLEIRL